MTPMSASEQPEDATADFVRLWTGHQAEVGRYVFAMVPRAVDAAEVLQEVSVRLWQKWSDYDTDRPFAPWAIRFAYLEVLKWRQRLAREKLVFSNELLEQLHLRHAEQAPLVEARRMALGECLQKLSDRERHLVEARYGRHGAIKDEAKRAGISIHKLYYALEKARTQLLDCIERTLKKEGWADA